MISFDTETTGVDFRHGAQPFFVTTADSNGSINYWEWNVDPVTRKVQYLDEDLDEIENRLRQADLEGIVLQNAKFDVRAMDSLRPSFGRNWRWDITQDTLLLGHLLASNQPKDLTSLAVLYLGVDIQPFEDRLETAVQECRRYCRGNLKDWRIAKAGLPEMPSAKEDTWKYDTWLPRAVASHLGHDASHPYWTVLQEYSNTDSAVTIALWKAMSQEVKQRGLGELYEEGRKLLEVCYAMEKTGITASRSRLEKLQRDFSEASESSGRVCVGIALSLGYELTLPKSGNNKSLTEFCFERLQLPVLKRTGTGSPSLDKGVIEEYGAVLPPSSLQAAFVRHLRGKRKRDTALGYMESYQKYWVPEEVSGETGEWYRLHPSLNLTGTDTLRGSSSNPNGQQISKQEGYNLRECFGPLPGREWRAFDYENIELRIPAYESGEQALINLFERSAEPPYYGSEHLLNFSVVYPEIWQKELREVGWEKVGPHIKKKYASTYYQWCKNGDFAVGYGAIDRPGGIGTADRAFHRPGSHARLKERFSAKEALNQKYIRFAEKYGYVETLPDKTVNPKRGYPILCTRTEHGRILPTVPLNYHVQGTAMWCTRKAMVRVHRFFQALNRGQKFAGKAWPGGYYLVLQVHDEIDTDMPALGKGNDPIVNEVKRLMELSGEDIGVPLKVAASYHPIHWAAEAKL